MMRLDKLNSTQEDAHNLSQISPKTPQSECVNFQFVAFIKEMESRSAERNFLSVFFGDVPEFEPRAPTQQITNPCFKTASRPLHTGYIRPLHLNGEGAKSSKIRRISDDDFWDSNDGLISIQDIEGLPNTAAKFEKHQDAATEKLMTLGTFEKQRNNHDLDGGKIDDILNKVRPGIALNRVQSLVRDCIFNSNESAVVGAPTGIIFHPQK
jgi:hypothetical protein